MSVFPRDVKDQIVEFPNRFKIDGVSHTIEPDFGTVTEPGMPVNRAYLQPIEDELGIGIPAKLSNIVFGYNPRKHSQTITTSQNWTVPEGVTEVDVWLVGGGGAGGGGRNDTGAYTTVGAGGGGGGGYCKFIKKLSVTPGVDIPVVIGMGGTGVSGANGNAGGNSSFGDIVANGGNGGTVSSNDNGIGGDGGSGGRPAYRTTTLLTHGSYGGFASIDFTTGGKFTNGGFGSRGQFEHDNYGFCCINPYSGLMYASGGGGGSWADGLSSSGNGEGGGYLDGIEIPEQIKGSDGEASGVERGGYGGYGGSGGGGGSRGETQVGGIGGNGAPNSGGGGGGSGRSSTSIPGGNGGSGVCIIYYD